MFNDKEENKKNCGKLEKSVDKYFGHDEKVVNQPYKSDY